jgi:drug/metabolite transporter (DMT)-like permease
MSPYGLARFVANPRAPLGPAAKLGLALSALYLIWGTTYLGMRIGVVNIPPLVLAALRFLLAGGLLFAWTTWRKVPAPSSRAWLRGLAIGTLMLTIGNGTVIYAIFNGMPSGVAALIVAMVPVWIVFLDWVLRGPRPRWELAAALVLGIGGVAVLAQEKGGWAHGVDVRLIFVIVSGSACWALGSLLSRKNQGPSFWQDIAIQALCGGAVLTIAAALDGELGHFHPSLVPGTTWLVLLYLSLFGSIVALGAYAWLLRNTTPAVATTYAFVNPVIAVAVGALFAGELVTKWTLGAGALIVAAVILIVWSKARRVVATDAPPAEA